MSGKNEDSDSWGSLVMNGIMNKMAKMTGLRVVKSVDQNGDHEQGQKSDQKTPKNVTTEKNDFQQKMEEYRS